MIGISVSNEFFFLQFEYWRLLSRIENKNFEHGMNTLNVYLHFATQLSGLHRQINSFLVICENRGYMWWWFLQSNMSPGRLELAIANLTSARVLQSLGGSGNHLAGLNQLFY